MRQREGGAGTRGRGTLLLLVFSAVCCGRGSDSSSTPLTITLQPAASRTLPAYVAVTGLDAAELSSLRTRAATDAGWPSLLKITVGGGGNNIAGDSPPAVEGRYAVTGTAITFTPLFPFDPGRPYRVVFDPSRLPHPRQAAVIAEVVRLPALAT